MQPSVGITAIIADELGLLREGVTAILRSDSRVTVVAECADGVSAMEAIRTHQPDVALLDVQMPGLFCLEILREVRESGLPTKAIMMSARRERRGVIEALRAGASGFILKTGSGRQLLDSIEHVMSGGVYIAPEIASGELFVPPHKGMSSDPVDSLSAREYQVFSLLVEGVRAKEIASRLHLSPKTVDTYRASMMRKLDIHDLAGLVRFSMHREANGNEKRVPALEYALREPALA